MELINAVLTAGPLGYFVRRHGLMAYLALWALIYPVQTVIVHSENPDDINPAYFVVNAAILAGGMALNRYAARLRERRRAFAD
jgi:hypothetical protein